MLKTAGVWIISELPPDHSAFGQLDGDLPITHVNGTLRKVRVAGELFLFDRGPADVAGGFRVAYIEILAKADAVGNTAVAAGV